MYLNYTKMNDGSWGCYTTVKSNVTQEERIVIGRGRRKEQAKSDLIRQLDGWAEEIKLKLSEEKPI